MPVKYIRWELVPQDETPCIGVAGNFDGEKGRGVTKHKSTEILHDFLLKNKIEADCPLPRLRQRLSVAEITEICEY